MRIIRAPGCERLQPEECTRQSEFKAAKLSLAHCWHQYYGPGKSDASSKSQELGTLTHCLTLEPGEFEARYVVAPTASRASTDGVNALIQWCQERLEDVFAEWPDPPLEMRTIADRKSYLAILEELVTASGIVITTEAELEKARAMKAAIGKIPGAMAILTHPLAQFETTLLWRDWDTNCPCRATLDCMVPPCREFPQGIILDLKTTKCAALETFHRDIEQLCYHWQGDHYRRGFSAVFGTLPPYGWIAVENTAPHCAAYYGADEEILAIARREYLPLLVAITEARASGVWPGYPTECQLIGPSRWLARKHEGEVE